MRGEYDEEDAADEDPVGAVYGELLPGREREPDVVGDRHREAGLEEQREERVEAEHQAVARVADVARNLEAAWNTTSPLISSNSDHIDTNIDDPRIS